MGRSRRRGQSAVEFALTLPLLFTLTLGLVDASLLVFSLAIGRGAVTDAALTVAEVGTHTVTLKPTRVVDADDAAVDGIRRSPIASLGFAPMRTIEVCKLAQDLTPVTAKGVPLCNVFDVAAGSWQSRPWDPATRVDTDRCADYFDITVTYQYHWLTGGMLGLRDPEITVNGRGRLEPLSYDAERTCP